MKFTVITPCRNAAGAISRTVNSVLSQSALAGGRAELQMIVVDGASTDGTVEILRKYQDPRLEVISERDRGMYDALGKGLRRASSDVVAYLNAGDAYSPMAFETVRTILTEHPTVDWLTGGGCYANERGEMISFSRPKAYAREFIAAGLYDGRFFPFIQQESTFWRTKLLDKIDLARLAGFRLAGDFFLWSQLARFSELHTVYSYLASFSYQKGQLSENIAAYFREMESARDAVSWRIRLAAQRERSGKRWRWLWAKPFLPRPAYGTVFYYDIKNHRWTPTPEAACP